MIDRSALNEIFKKNPKNESLISTHESVTIEYKRVFENKKLWKYAKTFAAFANNRGGFMIFGIKDRPHVLEGLDKKGLGQFEALDPSHITAMLERLFEPEIQFEKETFVFEGKTYGIIQVYAARSKPVICCQEQRNEKDEVELREGGIYYRYNGKSVDIKYPELQTIIEQAKRDIDQKWLSILGQIVSSGLDNISVLSADTKKLNTGNANVLVDDAFLRSVSYVKEGSFVETGGDPALMVVGKVESVSEPKKILIPDSKPKAINEYDILLGFLARKDVDSAYEYIEQICALPASTLPVYYYMSKAKMTVKDTISRLKKLPRSTQTQKYLIARLEYNKNTRGGLGKQGSKIHEQRKRFIDDIKSKEVKAPEDLEDAKHYLEALQALDAEYIQQEREYVMDLLYGALSKYYYDQNYKTIISVFRRAVCWVDEVLYRESCVVSNDH